MAGKFKKIIAEDTPVEVGAGLLNNASKSFDMEREERVYIDMDRLRANSKNDYSIADLEELADAIKMAGGILQDLIVKPMSEDGYYYITTGERRWRAAQLLRDRGDYPEKHGNKVPCQINDPQALELPLSEESKEDFAILVTNRYREKTDGDMFMEMQKWSKIFKELRAQGIEYLSAPNYTESGEAEQGVQIKGVSTRELLSKQLGISTGQVSRFQEVEKKGSGSVLGSLMNNEISLGEAEKIVDLPIEKQEAIMESNAGDSLKEKIAQTVAEHEEETVPKIRLSKKELQKAFDKISARTQQEDFALTEDQYKKYRRCMNQLETILTSTKE